MKTSQKEACNLCNSKRKIMVELPCGINTCGKCIEKSLVESKMLKRYKCTHCSRNHNIKDETVCENVKEKINKLKRKPRWVFCGETTSQTRQPTRSQAPEADDDDESDMDDSDNNNNAGNFYESIETNILIFSF